MKNERNDSENEKQVETRNENKENTSYQMEMLTKDEIRQYTHLIFLNMAKFSEKENDYFISQQALSKLLKENQIISDKVIRLSEVDILFKSISPKSLKLNSEQFLTFLIKLTQKIYPKEFKQKPKETLNFFLQNLFENYADILNNEKIPLEAISDSACQYKSIETLLTYQPDDKQIYLINKILFTLNEIYIKYFVFELDESNDLARKSVRNLISFSRDFEILPYIINETQLVTYYHLSINNNDNNIQVIDPKVNVGQNFTLNNFCIAIIQFSLLSYQKYIMGSMQNVEDSEVGKVLMFLEKMETSKGMRGFTRKLNRPSANKLSLIPPKEVFVQLGEINEETEQIDCNNTFSNPNIDENNMQLINNNIDGLEKTFLFFGRIGDKLNFDQMSLSSYIKFLKHVGLMLEISKKDKKKFTNLSKELSKTRNVSMRSNNTLNRTRGKSPPTEEEVQYKRTISKVVNSALSQEALNNGDKKYLGESDVNVIFSQLTGPRNFDSSHYIKAQIDKNSGYCTSFGNNANNSNNTIVNKNNEIKMLKMNFKTFIKSFELIASRIYQNDDKKTALSNLLNDYILPNLITEVDANKSYNKNAVSNNVTTYTNNNQNLIENTYEKICINDELKIFLKKLSESIAVYYQYYCDERNGMLDFNSLYEFYKNFALFPEIINLVQLKNIFSFLVSLKKAKCEKSSTNGHNNTTTLSNLTVEGKTVITFSDFLYSLAITGLLFDFDESFSDVDKLLYLVERMNQSPGIKKCQMKSGRTYTKSKDIVSFLLEMKKEYPDFYRVNNKTFSTGSILKPSLVSLDDIYGDEDEEREK